MLIFYITGNMWIKERKEVEKSRESYVELRYFKFFSYND